MFNGKQVNNTDLRRSELSEFVSIFLWSNATLRCIFGRDARYVGLHIRIGDIQWGEQVFDIHSRFCRFTHLQSIQVCHFYHRYSSTVSDGILNKNPENHIV